MTSAWRVIVQIDCSPVRTECQIFADIAVLDPAHIAIVAEPPELSKAERLYQEICQAISNLNPGSTAPHHCGGPRLLSCRGRDEPTCCSVLVVLTGQSQISHKFERLMHNWLRRPNSVVLPVLPLGADPNLVLPAPLNEIGVLFDPGRIEMLMLDVLRAARIGGEANRLFISYRRRDAQAVAEQLFDAFSHVGFRVFLDRYRGTPGRRFPRELAEELIDKGLVVVIESPNILRSPWTLVEVALARIFRLGLLALTMPGGVRFAMIPRSDRYEPSPAVDWRTSVGSVRRLTDAACNDFVEFIRRQYTRQIAYRRIYLENLLHRALAAHSLPSTMDAYGVHQVHSGSGGIEYAIHLLNRPPHLGDAHRVMRTVTGIPARSVHPVLLGPHDLLPPERVADIQWLANELDITLRREGLIQNLAASMAAGTVPP